MTGGRTTDDRLPAIALVLDQPCYLSSVVCHPSSDSMARRTPTFVCQSCGAVPGPWQGKCEACGEWNTIAEESGESSPAPGRNARKGRLFALEPLAGTAHEAPRLASGVSELDRVTGGGFVRG